MLSILLTAAVLPTLVLADSAVTIVNSCSKTIFPKVTGSVTNPAPLAPGASTTVNLNGNFRGTIGDGDNSNDAGTKAVLDLFTGTYYVDIDGGFTDAISIAPHAKQQGTFCAPVSCLLPNCPDAVYGTVGFPPGPSNPAKHKCLEKNLGFNVTFCPGNTPTPSFQIHPNGNKAKCLDVRGAKLANGTPVQIFDCNGTGAQKWLIHKDNTKVQLAGTNFCMDAGSKPGNNIGMKIWTCFDNLPAQAFFYTGDNRIALTGQGQCVDLTNGNLANSNQVQTFKCTDGNTNQIWTTTS